MDKLIRPLFYYQHQTFESATCSFLLMYFLKNISFLNPNRPHQIRYKLVVRVANLYKDPAKNYSLTKVGNPVLQRM